MNGLNLAVSVDGSLLAQRKALELDAVVCGVKLEGLSFFGTDSLPADRSVLTVSVGASSAPGFSALELDHRAALPLLFVPFRPGRMALPDADPAGQLNKSFADSG